LLVYLGRYHTLDAEQLKRVVNLIHRQVVKAHAEGLFFTIPSLHLFRCILDEKDSLPKGDGAKDLVQLISYILRQFFKQAEKDPWVIVEAALPKGRAQWQHLSKGGEDGDGMGGQRERIREQVCLMTYGEANCSRCPMRSSSSSRRTICRGARRWAWWSRSLCLTGTRRGSRRLFL
jgi:replication fork protection complex subunit Tof1/Swi1